MGARTRSAASSPAKKTTTSTLQAAEKGLETPLRILVSPHTVLDDARLLLLKHPRDETPTRFLFCPETGLLEIKRFSAPTLDPRSIILTYHSLDQQRSIEQRTTHPQEAGGQGHQTICPQPNTGHIVKEAEIMTATPFDLVFLLLRLLAKPLNNNQKAMFQPLDDVLDIPESDDKHFSHVLTHGRRFVEQAMEDVCDTVVAGDEKMFRYSEDKVLTLVISKARRVVARGLPASMDERFVLRPLESPMLSVSRTEEETTERASEVTTGNPASFDSQSTNSTSVSETFSVASETSTATSIPEHNMEDSTSFLYLQRLRTAITFVSSCYLPPALTHRLQARFASKDSPLNFGPLDAHLQHLRTLRSEALASRSMTDFSQKRGHADDDEAAEARAEKKPKLEEEERKQKANISRGVRDLKKVNVTGMKKMSDFFSKKSTKAVS